MKNCPRVECRRVSISMGAIYKAAYGTLSRREICIGNGQGGLEHVENIYCVEDLQIHLHGNHKELAAKDVKQCIQFEQNSVYQETNRPAHHWSDKNIKQCPVYGVVI